MVGFLPKTLQHKCVFGLVGKQSLDGNHIATSKVDGFIFMTIIYFAVYAFTWTVTLWFHKRDDKKINKALDDIRDEE